MTKTLIGDACADCGPTAGPGSKRRYIKIGAAFKGDTFGSISLKIDSLPLASEGWMGWVNIFERDGQAPQTRPPRPPVAQVAPRPPLRNTDDDIPF